MRMFHPKSFGYAEISNYNIQAIIESATGTAVDLNHPPADPPAVYIDQGNLNCKAQHNDGDPKYYFDMGGAITAISNFCRASVDGKTVLGPGGTAIQEMAESDGVGHNLDISATWIDGPNCPLPMDFSQDGAITTCEARLTEVIDNCMCFTPIHLFHHAVSCRGLQLTFSLPSGDKVKRVNPEWKQGGTFFRDCIVSVSI